MVNDEVITDVNNNKRHAPIISVQDISTLMKRLHSSL